MPLQPKNHAPLETLADARAYLLALPERFANRNEWRSAAAKLMEAAEGKVLVASARSALDNALIHSLLLDSAKVERD